MRKYLLEIIVFISGMGIMVFELVGSRVLAPYVGTTVMVWSALIGVILAFLSAGYWWGGKIADSRADYKTFSLIIFASAVLVCLTGFIKLPVINFLEKHMGNFKEEAVVASFILFGPGSFFMAAVSPYAFRLRIASLKDSGALAGRLYSISTFGSIVGTFLTGMVLVPLIGNTKIIFSLAVVLLFTSIVAYRERWLKARVAVSIAIIFFYFYSYKIDFYFLPLHFIHSAYQDIAVVPGVDTAYNGTGRPILQIFTSPKTIQSVMFADEDNELVLPYTRFFRVLSEFFHPDIKNALLIGGAGYSLPKDFLARNPGGKMDVVEIDPQMTKTAKDFFNLKDDSRLATYNEDGRTFLNRNQKKYDAVFIDSFRTYVVPFQLTTLEIAQKIFNSLTDKGIVLVNVIQSINGDGGKFLRAEYATYKKVFPQVYIFRVLSEDPNDVQNIMIVATKSSQQATLASPDEHIDEFLKRVWQEPIADDMPIITDDFAPVADYMLAASKAIKSSN